MNRYRLRSLAVLGASGLIAGPAMAGGWVTYTNETSLRLNAPSDIGASDPYEKDYAWGDVDQDGDTDLVVVRKLGFTTSTGKRNVLLMNESGVLTERTSEYIPDFLDITNDRDVVLVDINNDEWLDIVTATACNGCNSSSIVDDNRLYLNLGNDGGGDWLGYGEPTVLIDGPNNFCAVDGGDLDGDGNADLYFVSYNDNLEDQLLMGNGDGTFTNGNGRLTSQMRSSGFGSNVIFADMDNDDDLDIVKSENGPVETFRNNGSGFFDLLDPTYNGAAYHVGVGDLDNNGLLDVMISDDGTDRYILNNGNLMNGSADPSLLFPGSTGGFGSNSLAADLDGDGFNEAVIADVDVDAPGCSRISDILRNDNGNNFTADQANIPTSILTGVHDFAIFDLNDDTLLDIVVGRCSGTSIFVNSPPVAISFDYPGGLPEFVPPDTATDFDVVITIEGDSIDPGSESIFISTDGGEFVESPLTHVGGSDYVATIPGGACGIRFDFYLAASTSGGIPFFDPPTAPGTVYGAIAAEGTRLLMLEEFEGDVSSWTVESDESLISGEWEAVDPNATIFNSDTAAPGSDASPSGSIAFVTENGPVGADAADFDVDFGPTYVTSPTFDLTDSDGFISYKLWAFSAIGIHDVLTVEVSNDNGATWTMVESVPDTESSWQQSSFLVSSYVSPNDQVRVRFSTNDTPNDSVTEGGVDDFRIDTLSCTPIAPCPWDCSDGDGTVGIVDFLALLAEWGQVGTPCDVDGGGVGILDFLELLANWGPCP